MLRNSLQCAQFALLLVSATNKTYSGPCEASHYSIDIMESLSAGASQIQNKNIAVTTHFLQFRLPRRILSSPLSCLQRMLVPLAILPFALVFPKPCLQACTSTPDERGHSYHFKLTTPLLYQWTEIAKQWFLDVAVAVGVDSFGMARFKYQCTLITGCVAVIIVCSHIVRCFFTSWGYGGFCLMLAQVIQYQECEYDDKTGLSSSVRTMRTCS